MSKLVQLLWGDKNENKLLVVHSFLFRFLCKGFWKGVTHFLNLMLIGNFGKIFIMGENWKSCSHHSGRSAVERKMYELSTEQLVWMLLQKAGVGAVIRCVASSHRKGANSLFMPLWRWLLYVPYHHFQYTKFSIFITEILYYFTNIKRLIALNTLGVWSLRLRPIMFSVM